MLRPLFRPILAAAALLLGSCAGYEMSGQKPASLAHVERIAVPMAANSTQHPRAETIATSAIADALLRDGTYRISGLDHADAVLDANIRNIEYVPLRGTRFDTSLAEEFRSTISFDWRLLDARDPTRILALGSSSGTSEVFNDSNLQTARNNALNDAMESAAQSMISRIADSF